MDVLDEAFETIGHYRIPEDETELFNSLKESYGMFDYDAMTAALEC